MNLEVVFHCAYWKGRFFGRVSFYAQWILVHIKITPNWTIRFQLSSFSREWGGIGGKKEWLVFEINCRCEYRRVKHRSKESWYNLNIFQFNDNLQKKPWKIVILISNPPSNLENKSFKIEKFPESLSQYKILIELIKRMLYNERNEIFFLRHFSFSSIFAKQTEKERNCIFFRHVEH